ncbi:hypothetical protein BFU36_01165 [Sulfolobus sp. A20]|uniref:MFS transporter n=1 Tax=Sulfolobaceae TaxID=118883 RepID=UPI000845F4A2|nr:MULTISPECIES: MFS transporter [unclassified Sulfolobus]TRM74379.1 hypothetical protein DJ532_13010 [Sulfolobus sp. A20-N-F8]TRM76169.1 hypothetical protein DJ523_01555 [Sulfolobus sp. E5]TRM79226.1 hypothetical protein DJ528_02155 [Sulfolobus sp. B5]TRM87255.1 hypothetical protein DJ521_03935 [Sulfolobus sp. E3]TRM88924.1 hypothetical protein DJ529_03785 [Sulfolobus sp. C3]TRM92457.1 hypothetical protein DJ526_06015 [Sulfolobus sp. A20-N-G8]TRM98610.1 hypothetical protein DJ527_10210 [Sul
MSNNERKLISSWLIWSCSYYLYYPFLSIYFSQFVSESKISLLYLSFQAISLPYPIIGAWLYKYNRKLPVIIGMIIGGLGLILLPFSKNLYEMVIFMALNYLFYLSLPSFYSFMSEEGQGVITKIWSISIIPSLIMPSIAGLIAQYLGLRLLFIISGIIFSLASIPVLKIGSNKVLIGESSIKMSISLLFILLLILPIAISTPYIYLAVYLRFNLSKIELGVIVTIAEILGMIFSYISSRYIKDGKYLLSSSLILFSLISLYDFSPFFAIFFGMWEVIVPLSLELYTPRRNVVSDYAITIIIQSIGWLMGYAIDYLFGNVRILLVTSSIVAFLSAFIVLISLRK